MSWRNSIDDCDPFLLGVSIGIIVLLGLGLLAVLVGLPKQLDVWEVTSDYSLIYTQHFQGECLQRLRIHIDHDTQVVGEWRTDSTVVDTLEYGVSE